MASPSRPGRGPPQRPAIVSLLRKRPSAPASPPRPQPAAYKPRPPPPLVEMIKGAPVIYKPRGRKNGSASGYTARTSPIDFELKPVPKLEDVRAPQLSAITQQRELERRAALQRSGRSFTAPIYVDSQAAKYDLYAGAPSGSARERSRNTSSAARGSRCDSPSVPGDSSYPSGRENKSFSLKDILRQANSVQRQSPTPPVNPPHGHLGQIDKPWSEALDLEEYAYKKRATF